MRCRLDVALERALREFGAPGTDGVGEVMLADESFSNHVGVSERCGWVRKKVCEVNFLIGSNLYEG